jgi:hypothetical protein
VNVDAIKPETISIRDLRIGEANVPEQPEPASLVLQEAERPQIAAAPRKVEPKKPSGGTVATKVTARKSPLSAVRIVRALKATSYEVQPEKGGASTGSDGVTGGSPVNLLPSSGGQKDSGSSSSSNADQQGG